MIYVILLILRKYGASLRSASNDISVAMNFNLDLDCIKRKVGSLNWYILTDWLTTKGQYMKE